MDSNDALFSIDQTLENPVLPHKTFHGQDLSGPLII